MTKVKPETLRKIPKLIDDGLAWMTGDLIEFEDPYDYEKPIGGCLLGCIGIVEGREKDAQTDGGLYDYEEDLDFRRACVEALLQMEASGNYPGIDWVRFHKEIKELRYSSKGWLQMEDGPPGVLEEHAKYPPPHWLNDLIIQTQDQFLDWITRIANILEPTHSYEEVVGKVEAMESDRILAALNPQPNKEQVI